MFNLMRLLLTGKGGVDPRDLKLDDLREGWQVGFGFMSQAGLSGRRFAVTELRRYRFGNDHYTAYTLEDSGYKVQVVPARDQEGIPYIAVSRLIEISKLAQIVDTHALHSAIEDDEDPSVLVHTSLRSLKGWVVPRYTRALKKVEGMVSSGGEDESPGLFGKRPKQGGARRIYYSLFVNDEGTHALEVEQFANGRKQVYATVYRPATDIGQIAQPRRHAHGVTLPDDEAPPAREVPFALDSAVLPEERLLHTPPVLEEPPPHVMVMEAEKKEESPAAGPEHKEAPSGERAAAVAEPAPAAAEGGGRAGRKALKKALAAAMNSRPVTERPAPRVESASAALPAAREERLLPQLPEVQMLNCDMRVAGKVIEEALSSGLTLTQVVRKVMDLPAACDETVQLRLKLTERDRRALAERYGIDAEDPKAIADVINRELTLFVGEKT